MKRYFTPQWQEAWTDLLVNPSSVSGVGALAPERIVYKTDGASTSGHAISLDGVNQYGSVTDYADLDTSTGNYTIELWTKTSLNDGVLVFRDGYFSVSKVGSRLFISIADTPEIRLNNVFVADSVYHIVITVKVSGSRSIVKTYINAVRKDRSRIFGTLGASASDVFVGTDTIDYYEGVIDSFILYNVTLDSSQVSERYNGGAGSTSWPTGITEATDVIANFEFEEGTGSTVDNNCTLGAGQDMTLHNSPSWVDGLVATSSSLGVVVWDFQPGRISELFFSRQLPHSYKEGTDINPHIHWIVPVTATGNVVWGLEYVWASIGHAFTNTTVDEVTTEVWGKDIHAVTSFGDMKGTNKGISSVILCRLFRDGTNALDTFSESAYLMEFDFHYQMDYLGSVERWHKEG